MSHDDINELLKLASLDVEIKESKESKPLGKVFIRFMKDLNIRSGKDKVPAHILYQHFVDWCLDQGLGLKMSSTSFFRQIKSMYQSYVDSGERGYYLNKESFDMTVGYSVRSRMNRDARNDAKKKKKKQQSSE